MLQQRELLEDYKQQTDYYSLRQTILSYEKSVSKLEKALHIKAIPLDSDDEEIENEQTNEQTDIKEIVNQKEEEQEESKDEQNKQEESDSKKETADVEIQTDLMEVTKEHAPTTIINSKRRNSLPDMKKIAETPTPLLPTNLGKPPLPPSNATAINNKLFEMTQHQQLKIHDLEHTIMLLKHDIHKYKHMLRKPIPKEQLYSTSYTNKYALGKDYANTFFGFLDRFMDRLTGFVCAMDFHFVVFDFYFIFV